MGVLITSSDFVGRHSLTINQQVATMDGWIDRLEEKELIALMGIDLYNLFKVNPNDSLYLPLQSPMVQGRYYSSSIKDVILSFVYLQLNRDVYSQVTENGRVIKSSQNSTPFNPYVRDFDMNAEAVDGWKCLQMYCSTNYADFKGIDKPYKFY